MLEGACQEQIDRAAARHPGATNVDVACTVPACDRKGGAGTVVVTLADGTTVKETFAYAGDPAPVPAPACSGIALDVCRGIAATTVDGLPPSKSIEAISIACTAASCTAGPGRGRRAGPVRRRQRVPGQPGLGARVSADGLAGVRPGRPARLW